MYPFNIVELDLLGQCHPEVLILNNKKKRRQSLFFQIAKTKQYFGIFEFIDDHYYFGKLDRGRLSGVVVPIRK